MANEQLKSASDGLPEVRARHRDWGIWISSAGRYWATRRGNVQLTECARSGWAMTVDADSLAELEEQINKQNDLSVPLSLLCRTGRRTGTLPSDRNQTPINAL